MSEETRAILAASHEADRLTFTAIIVTVVFGLIMGAGFLSWEHQLKREAIENQEARATWVK